MSADDIETSEQDIGELLGYLRNIRTFEKDYSRSEGATVAMVWGLIMITAGVLDFYTALFAGYSPHGIIWIIALTLAYSLQEIIASQPLLFDIETDSTIINRASSTKLERTITSILMIGSFPVSIIPGVGHKIIMPYIGIVFGSTVLYSNIRYRQMKKEDVTFGSYPRAKIVVTHPAIAFYASAIINLIGSFFVLGYGIFPGLVFGVFIGISLFNSGYNARKNIDPVENIESN